jgi:hypothetical protein
VIPFTFVPCACAANYLHPWRKFSGAAAHFFFFLSLLRRQNKKACSPVNFELALKIKKKKCQRNRMGRAAIKTGPIFISKQTSTNKPTQQETNA